MVGNEFWKQVGNKQSTGRSVADDVLWFVVLFVDLPTYCSIDIQWIVHERRACNSTTGPWLLCEHWPVFDIRWRTCHFIWFDNGVVITDTNRITQCRRVAQYHADGDRYANTICHCFSNAVRYANQHQVRNENIDHDADFNTNADIIPVDRCVSVQHGNHDQNCVQHAIQLGHAIDNENSVEYTFKLWDTNKHGDAEQHAVKYTNTYANVN